MDYSFSLCVPCLSRYMWEQKKVLNPLELELHMVVGHLMWLLGTKLGCSARKASALNHGAISSAPRFSLFFF